MSVHDCLSLREFAEKTLENLRKKLRQKTTKNATKVRNDAELARNSQNYRKLQIWAKSRNLFVASYIYSGVVRVQITYRIMESTA